MLKVAIIGGGLAGSALAMAVRSAHHLDLTLVEQRAIAFDSGVTASAEAASVDAVADRRSSALSYSSQQLLQRFGVWPDIARWAAPIEQIAVSERGQFGQVALSSRECGVPALGYVIPNEVLGQGMLSQVARADAQRFRLRSPATLTQAQLTPEQRWVLQFDTSDGVVSDTFDLLVFADGGKAAELCSASLTEQSGAMFEQHRHDYAQVAIIANIRSRTGHERRAFERFIDEGAIALLPLAGDGDLWYSLVVTVNSERAQRINSLEDAAFIDEIQRLAGFEPGIFTAVKARQSYPLSLLDMPGQIGPACVVIGNAAHTLHPVAGQGFNLTLRDVGALANILTAREMQNADATAINAGLAAYGQARYADQRMLIEITDLLVELFMRPGSTRPAVEDDRPNRWLPVSVVSALRKSRRVGFAMLNTMPFARREFAEAAMGLWAPQAAPWQPRQRPRIEALAEENMPS
ncbi:2-octaprenyl-6-methoxyphenyl hydroxylase [Allohahella marinimesophila]|uniref:2-octaprenyl-6-methoxyphenyl hydroxylase n=2 Tax=Allohahella marinimesophila TaxID=1054972 RepID=A0ABP7PKG5_9GAMM